MIIIRCGLPVLLMLVAAWAGSAAQAPTFEDLFARYRGTQAEEAIREFAKWSESRVAAEARLSAAQRNDPWAVAALALLHLESSERFASAQRELDPSPSTLDRTTADYITHVLRSRALIEDEVLVNATQKANPDLLTFCRDWYLVFDSIELRPGTDARADAVERAQRDLGDHPEIQLLHGIWATRAMGPFEEGDGPFGFGSLKGEEARRGLISVGRLTYYAGYARDAEVAFQRTLKLAPSLVEARLRLGRLYQVLGRQREAQSNLELAASEASAAGDRVTGYLAALFLGQLHEEAGRLPDAEGAYRTAMAIYPGGTSARLALGSALFMAGRADDGWTAMRSALGAHTHLTLRDPWAVYRAFGYWQVGPRLAAMRRRVSATPLATVPLAVARDLDAQPGKARDTAPLPASRAGPVFRGGVDGVRVETLVMDGERALPGLTAADFAITDNGVRQQVVRSVTAGAVSVALALDASHSVSDATGRRYLRTATDSVERAIVAGDLVSVVSAGDRIQLRADLLASADALRSALGLAGPRQSEHTALWDAVLAGGSLVAESPGHPLVLVVSDGSDNVSWFSRRRAIDRLKRQGLTVDGISIPVISEMIAADLAAGDINLRDPALATGGVAFDVRDPDLNKKIADRFAALRQSYLLMYTPTDVKPQKDGWHEIKVTLRPGLKGKVQARPGYYVPIGK